jgi:hypothetical protein
MAIIGKHQELPRERWKLYDHAVSVLIEHWDVKRHLDSINVDAPFIGEDDKKELLRRLAYRMQAGSGGLKGNYIHREQLQQEFHDYLVERFTLTADRATTISRLMIDQFRQRNFILSLYGASVYGFVHRAFLEYFCATAFTFNFEKAHSITIDELATKVFAAHWNDQSWHEVLRLICGILNERFAGRLVLHLLSLGKSAEDFDDRVLNVELALRCLGEVRNLNSIADTTDAAMDAVMKAFEYATAAGITSFETWDRWMKLVSAAKAIGVNWPNRARLAQLLRNFTAYEWGGTYATFFGDFVGSIGAGMEDVRRELVTYARSKDENLRSLWPDALASGWKTDPSTPILLKQQVSEDPVEACRRSALGAYFKHYGDNPESFSLARKLLESDNSGMVRSDAINYLWIHGSGVPNSVYEAHLADDHPLVRATAFNGLRDEMTLPMFRELLAKESVNWLRRNMYTGLAERHRNKSQTRELLLNGAKAEEDPATRSHLLELLAEHFAGDQETWDFLRGRRQEDSDPSVQALAETIITDHEQPLSVKV